MTVNAEEHWKRFEANAKHIENKDHATVAFARSVPANESRPNYWHWPRSVSTPRRSFQVYGFRRVANVAIII